ncbi:MAG: hypothetical protein BRD49_04895 [Bacteroidetes bacterium SW_10_40_5]|nr:MAG: hypothetical protein BRD49_04895 [Bacteroidetes bacterium SW_10_40_5]
MQFLKLFCGCLILLSLLAVPFRPSAQSTDESSKPGQKENFWDRLVYGGNAGLQFGNNTLISVSPTVGYKLTDEWITGIRGIYQYYKFNGPRGDFETNIYGGSVFTNYMIFKNIFLHSEYERLNFETYNSQQNELVRVWDNNFLLGGGLRQPVGGNVYMNFQALYNLTYSTSSPYSKPWVINVGLMVY